MMQVSTALSGLLMLVLAGALALGAPWWVIGVLAPPALLWAPGVGWGRWTSPEGSRLDQHLDGAWIAMAAMWLIVALGRELGVLGPGLSALYVGLAGIVWGAGLVVGRAAAPPPPLKPGPRVGVVAVFVAIVAVFAWRSTDVLRPLHDHWFLEGADQHAQHTALPLRPGTGWKTHSPVGWSEAGAEVWEPEAPTDAPLTAEIIATEAAHGTLVLALQGPIGSKIQVRQPHSEIIENTVLTDMQEVDAEFPEARYLSTGGVAAVAVPVALDAGDALHLTLDVAPGALPAKVFFMPSTEAIWALHATGVLRYTHRWQILNQVENQVWANEMQTTRRFTWNQPPGWSPLLTMQVQLTGQDLNAAGLLFLWVLSMVGLSGVRAGHALAPGAPVVAWLAPAGLVASHGLLMLEPASHNFPDSLYAAAVVSLIPALVHGGSLRFGLAGVITQALRWPGTVVAALVLGAAALWMRTDVKGRLASLFGLVAVGGLVAVVAIFTGDAEDLAFVLYFETFPEHWHGEYAAGSLLPRIPSFYALWLAYTGGGIGLAALAAIGPRNPARVGLWVLLTVAGTYSLLLCTIDHHPTHYFLPLVALTGPAIIAASASLRRPAVAHALVALHALGLLWFLSGNRVW